MIVRHIQPFERVVLFGRQLFILLLVSLAFSCDDKKEKFESPPGYDFSKGYRYTLPSILNEISGLSYYPKDSSVFAINDEKGFLFKIHFGNPIRVERWKFGNGADYEDIVYLDSSFFVLKSKGLVEKINFPADSMSSQPFPIPVQGKNEFESLYYDDSLKKIIAVCKDCNADDKLHISSFAFYTDSLRFDSSYIIDIEQAKKKLKEDKRVKPSAAAVNPVTGELFIIASVNKALIVLNKDRTVKDAYQLDPKLFKQPEGMTFTPKGDLLVSNEAGSSGSADILIFKYNPQKKQQ